MRIEKFGSVLVPANGRSIDPDLHFRGGMHFYQHLLGMTERFRDGNRFAAFDCNGVTVALAAPPERPKGSGVAIALQVDDVLAWHRQLKDEGARCGEPVEGGHETRLTVVDPFGHELVLYAPRKPA